jgi:pyruvate, water dikinase
LATGLPAAPGQAIAYALVLNSPGVDLSRLPRGQILVVPSLRPEWLPLLKHCVGIVCQTGGLTSHGAIMARELGLPAVVGVGADLAQIQSGQVLWLNGDLGQVFGLDTWPEEVVVAPSTQVIADAGPSSPVPVQPKPTQIPVQRPPIQMMVSLSQQRSIAPALELGVDGVGLLRSELMILDLLQGQHPCLWAESERRAELQSKWVERLGEFVTAFAPRPVFYRTLDLRSHEYRPLIGGEQFEPQETNPMLGLRGVARYRVQPDLLALELAVLAEVSSFPDVQIHLMLPFVRSVDEFLFCRQQIEQVGLWPRAQIWMMAEVPSVLFLLPEYVRAGVQGIAIGTNDLTQLLLGVDREEGRWAAQLDANHPAVRAAIAQLICQARELDIGCRLCGEALLFHPEMLEWLVAQGIPGLSVPPEAVSMLRALLAKMRY